MASRDSSPRWSARRRSCIADWGARLSASETSAHPSEGGTPDTAAIGAAVTWTSSSTPRTWTDVPSKVEAGLPTTASEWASSPWSRAAACCASTRRATGSWSARSCSTKRRRCSGSSPLGASRRACCATRRSTNRTPKRSSEPPGRSISLPGGEPTTTTSTSAWHAAPRSARSGATIGDLSGAGGATPPSNATATHP